MKKLLLITTILMFSIIYSQSSDYESKVKETKMYVENIYKNDSSKIKSYVKNSQNGKIYLLKSLDVYEEYGCMMYDNIYQIVEKDNNIVSVKKLPYYWAEGMAFNESFYEYYFDENKRLIGAKKSAQISYYENSKNVSYNIEYILSEKTDKLERNSKYYAGLNGKKLDSKSKIVKQADKDGLTKSFMKFLDQITFRDLEGFMKTEKIKYYRTEENEPNAVISEPKKNIGKKEVISEKNSGEKKGSNHIGNLKKGRDNNGDPLGWDRNGYSKIGVDRRLVDYIPGTSGRGGAKPSHSCSASGSITIFYTVDKAGNVVSARRSGGVSDPCVISTSISWVKKYVKAEEFITSSSGIYKITF